MLLNRKCELNPAQVCSHHMIPEFLAIISTNTQPIADIAAAV